MLGKRCQLPHSGGFYEYAIVSDCCSAELWKLGRGAARGDSLRRSVQRVYTVEHNRAADSDYDAGGGTKSADPKRAVNTTNADLSVNAANHAVADEPTEWDYSKYGGTGSGDAAAGDNTANNRARNGSGKFDSAMYRDCCAGRINFQHAGIDTKFSRRNSG